MTLSEIEELDAGAVGDRPLLKVCGVTSESDVAAVGGGGGTVAGLWWGISDGPHALPAADVERLAPACRELSVDPWLVTFAHDPAAISEVLKSSGIRSLQLHAFQAPRMVHELRGTVPEETVIVKVLHLTGGTCLEGPLLRAYERAGANVFLLDSMSAAGQVGSTGQTLDPVSILKVVEKVSLPFLLAGGLSAANADQFALIASHPRFLGIDVDTAARDTFGKVDASRISAIADAWGLATERSYA